MGRIGPRAPRRVIYVLTCAWLRTWHAGRAGADVTGSTAYLSVLDAGSALCFWWSLPHVYLAPSLLEARLGPFHRCDGRGDAIQEFVLNLDWRSVADPAVEPAVVEPVDVFGRRDLKVVDTSRGSFVADQFGVKQRVECPGKESRSCRPWTRPRRQLRRRRDVRCIEWLDIERRGRCAASVEGGPGRRGARSRSPFPTRRGQGRCAGWSIVANRRHDGRTHR